MKNIKCNTKSSYDKIKNDYCHYEIGALDIFFF